MVIIVSFNKSFKTTGVHLSSKGQYCALKVDPNEIFSDDTFRHNSGKQLSNDIYLKKSAGVLEPTSRLQTEGRN
jgi:hypothetical protein